MDKPDPIATVREAQGQLREFAVCKRAAGRTAWADEIVEYAGALDAVVAEIGDMMLRLGDARDVPVDTGNPAVDRVLSRLASADPDFPDIQDAAVLLRRLAADAKGPDGYETWKDAAIAERARAARQAQEIAALRRKHDALLYAVAKLSAWEMASSLNVVPPRTPAELADLERTHQEAVQQVLVAAGLRDAVRDKEAQR